MLGRAKRLPVPHRIGIRNQGRVPELATLVHVANLTVLQHAAEHLARGLAIAPQLLDDAEEHFFFLGPEVPDPLQHAGAVGADSARLGSLRFLPRKQWKRALPKVSTSFDIRCSKAAG